VKSFRFAGSGVLLNSNKMASFISGKQLFEHVAELPVAEESLCGFNKFYFALQRENHQVNMLKFLSTVYFHRQTLCAHLFKVYEFLN
jgi:hypothetical protein